jgi:hypothetical protein
MDATEKEELRGGRATLGNAAVIARLHVHGWYWA